MLMQEPQRFSAQLVALIHTGSAVAKGYDSGDRACGVKLVLTAKRAIHRMIGAGWDAVVHITRPIVAAVGCSPIVTQLMG